MFKQYAILQPVKCQSLEDVGPLDEVDHVLNAVESQARTFMQIISYICNVMSLLEILALICGIVGVIGSIAPVLPGPPLSWIGMLLLYFAAQRGECDPVTLKFLIIWLIIVTIVAILGYIVPAWFTKATGGHKAASTGTLIGMFVGLFSPVGIILGSLLGAFVGEFVFEKKGVWESFKASIGAFLGFIFGTGLTITTTGIMLYYIIKIIF